MDDKQQLLVLRAQTGDRDAMEALLLAWERPMYEFLVRVIGHHSWAEDVLQDVLVVIVRKLYQLQDPASFRGWALRIASRAAVRALKKHREWPRILEQPDQVMQVPSGSDGAEDWLEHVPQLLATTSPASRLVLELHYLQSMTLSEIATMLNIPLGTVKSRLSYGVQSIRNQIATFKA